MKPKHFVLFPWGMISRTGERAEKLLESIKECGFNGSCFVTENEFDICRKLGLDIYYSMNDNGGQERQLRHEIAMADPAVSEEELRNIVYGFLKDLPKDVHSVYVTDERGTAMFPRVKSWRIVSVRKHRGQSGILICFLTMRCAEHPICRS